MAANVSKTGAWIELDAEGKPVKVVYSVPVSGVQLVAPGVEPSEQTQALLDRALTEHGTK